MGHSISVNIYFWVHVHCRFDRLMLRTAATDGARLVPELAAFPDLYSALKQSALGILSKSCQTEKKENVTQEIGVLPCWGILKYNKFD